MPIDELVEFQRRHKADQEARGSISNVFKDEANSPACAVRLYQRLRELKPDFFHSSNGEAYMFTRSGGTVLKASALDAKLKAAANRLGFNTAGNLVTLAASGRGDGDVARRV